MDVTIVGAGIGGLTLALELHQAGIPCRVLEAAGELQPIGAGINILPHAMQVLTDLGVADRLAAAGIETAESVFFNRFGQFVYREPTGRHAGYRYPQLSMHRGDVQLGLLAAVRERLGNDAVQLGRRVVDVADDRSGATVTIENADGSRSVEHSTIVVGCDGVHSAVRAHFYPDEGEPQYSGITMWRGVTVSPPILSGASMIRAGWLASGKMVIYPVRNAIDAAGNQLVNWVAEVERPRPSRRDWNRTGRLEDFIDVFEDWHFDWLDVPELIRGAETILEYPMVDQDPLPRWTFGHITLLGDAAHPMVPRGSNGAGQAILDARALRAALVNSNDAAVALARYEAERLPATAAVVETNRIAPPDTILKVVYERTGDKPFSRIEDVVRPEELAQISDRYKQVAGYDHERLESGR